MRTHGPYFQTTLDSDSNLSQLSQTAQNDTELEMPFWEHNHLQTFTSVKADFAFLDPVINSLSSANK